MSAVGVLLKFIAKPGMKAALEAHLIEQAGIAGGEPGTLCFVVHASPIEPDAVFLYEAYVNEGAKALHESASTYAAVREKTGHLTVGHPVAIPLLPLKGKGLNIRAESISRSDTEN